MRKFLLHITLLFVVTTSSTISHAQSPEEWYLYTPDKLNIYMYEFGKGDTVVVLHGGFGAEHSYLIDALEPFRHKFHFILFDQRGSLRSPAPDSLLSFEKLISDIETIRTEMGLQKLTLLGHSMGTRLAMAYAAKHPDHVQRLVLLSSEHPVTPTSDLRTYALYYLQNRDAVAKAIDAAKFPANKQLWTPKMYTYNWRISFASTNMYHVDQWKTIRGGVAFFNQRTANIIYPSAPAEWNYLPVFNKSTFPISVINGEYDYYGNFTALSFRELVTFYSRKTSTTLTAILAKRNQTEEVFFQHKFWNDYTSEIPSLEVTTIRNAGHRIWMDNPGAFRPALEKALRRN